jgi:hypothetical protein
MFYFIRFPVYTIRTYLSIFFKENKFNLQFDLYFDNPKEVFISRSN